jgi:hypothetical protein
MAKTQDNPTLADKPAEPVAQPETKPTVKVETLAATPAKPQVDPNSDGPGTYRVTLGTGEDAKVQEVEAENRNHAWALLCDRLKSWPSPKRVDRKIERIA